MSLVHKEDIICPKCQTKGKFDIWESMNVDLNPELRDKVFNDDTFIYKCPECGEEIVVPYDFIYHDMKHKFIIIFSFFIPEDFKYEPIEIPQVSETTKDYTFRHVIGINELREKILILEKGLNDVAIEHMKYACSHYESPLIAENGDKLFFGDVRYNIPDFPRGAIVFFVNMGEEKSRKLAYPLNLFYHQCLACELDPRMKVTGCEAVDEGWIALKLSWKAYIDKGIGDEPIDEKYVKNKNGFFIVDNTNKEPKGLHKEGIAHVNGDLVFPMIYDDIKWFRDGDGALARHGKKTYILTPYGGIFDPEKAQREMNNN